VLQLDGVYRVYIEDDEEETIGKDVERMWKMYM